MKNKKLVNLIIIAIFIILIIMAIIISIIVRSKKPKDIKKHIDIEKLENNFSTIFTNSMYPEDNTDIVYLAYDINKEENSKYKINTKIPNVVLKTKVTELINVDIFNTFVKTIAEIMKETNKYTIYNIDYVSYLNNNILSIVIRCKVKEGANPQRTIIKTYNYDMENDKLLTLQDIIESKELEKSDIQEKILNKIEKVIDNKQTAESTGYNIYKRNIEDEKYKIDNTTEYFLGVQNVLYILYPYGNNNYTSEIDLIILE